MLCAYRGISKYHHYSPSLEPTIYRTRSEHANYYATDVISNIRCFTLQTVDYTYVFFSNKQKDTIKHIAAIAKHYI